MPAVPPSPARGPLYRGYRLPAGIISDAVWLYYRFALSNRDVEDLRAERSIVVSYGAIGLWCRTFGPVLAAGLRRHRRRAGGKWHRDEVQLSIKGKRHWPWREVDAGGVVLDIPVQERRNQEAAERFLRRVVDGERAAPRVVVTDKLAGYPPAFGRVLPGAEHRRHRGLNNRAEHSHRPVPKRERTLQPIQVKTVPRRCATHPTGRECEFAGCVHTDAGFDYRRWGRLLCL